MRVFVRTILEKQLIQLARRTESELQKDTLLSKQFTRESQAIDIYNAFSWWLSRIAVDIFRVGAIMYIAFAISRGEAQIGEIVIIGMVFATINRYYDSLLASFQFFQDQFIHIEEFWKYIDALIPFIGYQKGSTFISSRGGLKFDDLDFAYANGGKIFENFNFQIQHGITTAIVGRSGAGKSTLIKLIL
jgi:ABC-type multidrug transport system fused ATPase/permease subunit